MCNSKSEHRRVLEEYSRLAAQYDERWASYIRSSVDECLKHVAPSEVDRLLDVGCGTGTLLAKVRAEHPAVSLTGVDPVDKMLALAARKLGVGAALCRSWAETLPFASTRFDTVVTCNAFHYVSLPRAALAEFHRVLRPGGRLVLTDWCADYLFMRLLGLYLRAVSRPLHRVYGSRELSALAEAAGFCSVRVDRFRFDRIWGLMTLTAHK